MGPLTTDMDGMPIELGTVVVTDDTVSSKNKAGTVVEVVFRKNETMLKVSGVRGLVENLHVSRAEFTDFETMLFNALSERKVCLTLDETHELASALIDAARQGLGG